jgi:glycosyltransferase involved in cell wall biosynthesis
MRILSIAFALATVSDAAVGGAEQVLATLDRALTDAGHESVVVAAANSSVSGTLFGTPAGPAEINRDYYAFRYVEHKRQILRALESGSFDLVHMHGFDFWEFIPDVEVPILATLHLPPQWYPARVSVMSRRRFHLNCVSESQRVAMIESPSLVRTICNGVNIPPGEPLSMSERTGAVILGRICPEKGTHLGIVAARRAGVSLTIAGRASAYPEHIQYFRDQIFPAIRDRVTYSGPVGAEDKINLLRSAKCLLVPSIAPETSSLTAMEALSCGTPVIALRSGALPEIVEHGKTGFVVDTAELMSEAISHVDEIDPSTCRKSAVQRFSAERMSREYIELYQQLIGLHPRIPATEMQFADASNIGPA